MRNRNWDSIPILAIAFGVGMLVALFFSFRLALILTAITIIILATRLCRRRW